MEIELPTVSNQATLAVMRHSLSVVVLVNHSLQKMQRHLLYEFSLVVCPTSRACCIQANKLLLKESVVKYKMSYSIIYSFTY